MKFKKRGPQLSDKNITRKQLRHQKRKDKKQRKQEYFKNRNNPNPNQKTVNETPTVKTSDNIAKRPKHNNNVKLNTNKSLLEEVRDKEMKEMAKLKIKMEKQRRKLLIKENEKEDKNIRHLEKQLNLHKRKSKAIPQSFTADGLDYLLEVCDTQMRKNIAVEEQIDDNEEFEEDLKLMSGELKKKNVSKSSEEESDDSESTDDIQEAIVSEDSFEEESENEADDRSEDDNVDIMSDQENVETEEWDFIVSEKIKKGEKNILKRKRVESKDNMKHVSEKKKLPLNIMSDKDSKENISDLNQNSDGDEVSNDDEMWEDIYGRKRRKDGSVVEDLKESKYVPPALRANNDVDTHRAEKLNKLRKQLKGLINRLAERNMHSISSEIENMYMNNSRNDMNTSITNLILESLISHVATPERLLMEHVLLVVILHANVGSEVGAHFLQTVAKQFDCYLKENHPVENKMLDNVVNVLSYLYDFKLFDSKLLYEIIDILSKKFEEKEVESILHILKNVGFSLRKDDPLALKDLIVKLHQKAQDVPEEIQDNARVKFMLEILLAIKNNNVRKIPNYDPSHSEHLKKLMKGFIRKGNYVTQLNISLSDLLSADEKGKWWVVGSAWSGNTNEAEPTKTEETNKFPQKILKQAKKHRMNTDSRKNIFCIIMSAEDYLDAFEKLLHLGLKNQQEREIIDIILYCLLHEKQYNPYFTVLIRKFCECNRKYQMMLKYAVWDKLKIIDNLSAYRLASLAKLLIHLFIKKALSISTLKIIEFGELNKVIMRFVRQILLGILLHEDEDEVISVFENIAKSNQLKMFKERINLFIHHFLLKNLEDDGMSSDQKALLESRAKIIERLLLHKNKFAF